MDISEHLFFPLGLPLSSNSTMIHGLFNAKFYALLNTNVLSKFYNYFYNPFMKIDHTGVPGSLG